MGLRAAVGSNLGLGGPGPSGPGLLALGPGRGHQLGTAGIQVAAGRPAGGPGGHGPVRGKSGPPSPSQALIT